MAHYRHLKRIARNEAVFDRLTKYDVASLLIEDNGFKDKKDVLRDRLLLTDNMRELIYEPNNKLNTPVFHCLPKQERPIAWLYLYCNEEQFWAGFDLVGLCGGIICLPSGTEYLSRIHIWEYLFCISEHICYKMEKAGVKKSVIDLYRVKRKVTYMTRYGEEKLFLAVNKLLTFYIKHYGNN